MFIILFSSLSCSFYPLFHHNFIAIHMILIKIVKYMSSIIISLLIHLIFWFLVNSFAFTFICSLYFKGIYLILFFIKKLPYIKYKIINFQISINWFDCNCTSEFKVKKYIKEQWRFRRETWTNQLRSLYWWNYFLRSSRRSALDILRRTCWWKT